MVESDPNHDDQTAESKNNENMTTELQEKIIRQVEYYFGDFNLVKDKFLQEQIKEDDGWVPLATLLTFNRLSNLSKESKDIVEALEKSTSGLVEIHDSKEKIRRSPQMPLPEMNEDRRKQLMERTVYCKGFPRDSKLNDLLEFFYKHGEIENVAMRSWNDKAANEWKFKGSVFVIFKTVAGAETFLKLESVKYKDEELIKKWQKDYIEEKRKERLESRMKHGKKSKGQESKKDENKEEGESKAEDKEDAKDDEEEEKEENDGFATGTVVELTGLDSAVKWDSIKETIEEMGLSVAFIENISTEVAFVRLSNKDAASELAKLVAADDNKLKIGDKELNVRVVEGEEEATYLEKQKATLMKKRNAAQKRKAMNKKGRGGRGRNRGKWDNRKRRGTSPAGQPPSKVKPEASDSNSNK
uniref:Putative rna-binding protein la n=1 Tax=Panstrongylus megistus TaxID=65343 RepID=A0A069DU10_9HEMI